MMSFVKKNKYILVAAAILLAGSYGGYKYYQSTQVTTTAVKMGEVKKGNIMQTVSATGALSAQDNVDISSKITGRIVEVLVKENQHVNAGDVLVRLDATSLNATLAQMQAKLHNAQANYERNLNLLNRGAISQSTFDSVEADYLVAKSNYEKAASDVNDTVITTPISGYIIGKPTPVGQTISSGISTPQVIMSVATLDNMEIEALVDESDIGQVKDGQKVKFTVDAYPNETFTGKVRLISRSATTENNVIYYKVYVTVDDAKGKLLPTMTARTEIIIDEANDVHCPHPGNPVQRNIKQLRLQISPRRSWIFCSFSQASKISALKSVFFLYRYVRSVSLQLSGTVLQMKLTSLLYLAPCFWKYFSLLQYFSLFCQAVEFHFPSLPYAPSQKHVCNALTGPHSDDT